MVTQYAGKQGTVTLRFAECDACGSEMTCDADSRANKRAVLAFRKSVDGPNVPVIRVELTLRHEITSNYQAMQSYPYTARAGSLSTLRH